MSLGVPKELLKASEQLGGFPISQLLRIEELLQASLFRACSLLDEAGLQWVIEVVLRDGEDKVLDLSSKLWCQGDDHILGHRDLYRDLVCGKLSFNLGTLDVGISGPEAW